MSFLYIDHAIRNSVVGVKMMIRQILTNISTRNSRARTMKDNPNRRKRKPFERVYLIAKPRGKTPLTKRMQQEH